MSNRFQPAQLGPYRITALLGRGGMGMVYEGVHEQTGEIAALKVLNPGLAADESFRDRFQAEIESLRKLKHPNIVQLFGFGQDGGHLYYVMERVRGRNLQEELAAGRRFTWREVARMAIQVCGALKHAHDHGIIHRDLKPANLLWTEDEQVKLTDFGIARLFGTTRLTHGSVLGTADYMAPEQAAGVPVNSRCDLYSLGCVLYALLVGRPPFTGKTAIEVIQKAQRDPPLPPSQFVTDLPEALDRLILQLLEKKPQSRVATALAVSHRLQAMQRALSIDLGADLESSAAGELPATGVADEVPLDDPAVDRRAPADVPASAPRADRRRPAAPLSISDQPTVAVEVDERGRPVNAGLDDSLLTAGGLVASPAVPVGSSPGSLPLGSASPGSMPLASPPSAVPAADPAGPQPLEPPFPSAAESDTGVFEPPDAHRRYTPVDAIPGDDRFDRRHGEFQSWWAAAALVALVLGLAAIFAFARRPQTADRLFTGIAAVTQTAPPRGWSEIAPKLNEFLERFPEDPRAKQVAAWRQELEVDRYARRLELLTRRGGTTASPLHPYEQHYLQAVDLAQHDPAAAAERLTALIDLASLELETLAGSTADKDTIDASQNIASQNSASENDASENSARENDESERTTVLRCLEAAKRKREQLDREVAAWTSQHRGFIQRQLAEAAKWQTSHPARSRAILTGLVTLYGTRSWADDLIDPARQALSREVPASDD